MQPIDYRTTHLQRPPGLARLYWLPAATAAAAIGLCMMSTIGIGDDLRLPTRGESAVGLACAAAGAAAAGVGTGIALWRVAVADGRPVVSNMLLCWTNALVGVANVMMLSIIS